MSTIVKIIIGDITKFKVDAIVNGANSSLSGGGGTVDAAVHKAAGPKLLEELEQIGKCKVGDAKITNAYDLPATKIIHTVTPIWIDGNNLEKEDLGNCYKNSLELAVKNNLKSVAFPFLGTGTFRFPKEIAFKIAIESVRKFTGYSEDLETIFFVAFNKENFESFKKLF